MITTNCMKRNVILSVIAAVLFAVSAFAFCPDHANAATTGKTYPTVIVKFTGSKAQTKTVDISKITHKKVTGISPIKYSGSQKNWCKVSKNGGKINISVSKWTGKTIGISRTCTFTVYCGADRVPVKVSQIK